MNCASYCGELYIGCITVATVCLVLNFFQLLGCNLLRSIRNMECFKQYKLNFFYYDLWLHCSLYKKITLIRQMNVKLVAWNVFYLIFQLLTNPCL